MASASYIMLFLLCWLFGLFEVLDGGGVVYKVGDGSGWTSAGNINYADWAVNKSFRVGDFIVFEYNPLFHNVMRVTHGEYRACNASNPVTIYSTGNDTVAITTHGHHFFLCGVPGHCQAGQKVDVNVLDSPVVAPSAHSGSRTNRSRPLRKDVALQVLMLGAIILGYEFSYKW